jgi:hypothetical protein
MMPSRFLHGITGQHVAPVVVVPARVAAALHRLAALDRIRVEHRGADPEFDAVLAALAGAHRWWRSTAPGTQRARPGTERSPSTNDGADAETWSTADAANAAGVSERAVAQGRLRGPAAWPPRGTDMDVRSG